MLAENTWQFPDTEGSPSANKGRKILASGNRNLACREIEDKVFIFREELVTFNGTRQLGHFFLRHWVHALKLTYLQVAIELSS